MKLEAKTLLNRMNRTRAAKEEQIEAMEKYLEPYIKFEFTVDDIAGDGWALCYRDEIVEITFNHCVDDSSIAWLEKCLDVIQKKGKLTVEDFSAYTF